MKNNSHSHEKSDETWKSFNRREKDTTIVGGTIIAGLISLFPIAAVVGIKEYIDNSDKQEQINSDRRLELVVQAHEQGVSVTTVDEKIRVPVLLLSESDREFARSTASDTILDLGIDGVQSTLILGLPSDLTKTDASSDYSLAPLGPSGLPVPVLTGVNPEISGLNYRLTADYNQDYLDTHDINVQLASTEDLGDTTASIVFNKTTGGGGYWLHLDSTETNITSDPALIVTVSF